MYVLFNHVIGGDPDSRTINAGADDDAVRQAGEIAEDALRFWQEGAEPADPGAGIRHLHYGPGAAGTSMLAVWEIYTGAGVCVEVYAVQRL